MKLKKTKKNKMENSLIILSSAIKNNFTAFDISNDKLKCMVNLEITKKRFAKEDRFIIKYFELVYNSHQCSDQIELIYFLKKNFDRLEYKLM
jgi:hypothetical protein